MNRPSKRSVWVWSILTLACCAGTLVYGANVVAARAIVGLASLFGGRPSAPPGNAALFVALAPAAFAVAGNAWTLWGRSPPEPGVSPWWLAPAFLIAAATFLFAAYVCVDVW